MRSEVFFVNWNYTKIEIILLVETEIKLYLNLFSFNRIRNKIGWHRGVAVERRTRDREVVGSSLDRALRRKNSGQVSHT